MTNSILKDNIINVTNQLLTPLNKLNLSKHTKVKLSTLTSRNSNIEIVSNLFIQMATGDDYYQPLIETLLVDNEFSLQQFIQGLTEYLNTANQIIKIKAPLVNRLTKYYQQFGLAFQKHLSAFYTIDEYNNYYLAIPKAEYQHDKLATLNYRLLGGRINSTDALDEISKQLTK